ncbi:Ger(x)C family spore germination protein [Tumebacillus sp. ITR2]|uniref:Ger(X)C family spore germination protein n=1 Tax=Tumebacillus amylolyticus TaxID=2801339 RepID=A0ABS1J7P9_9BACL|nr:Ger(x)C family spore germination protein [Tumebacillus amylolyticus]MBL0386307.1 Ger(x)C family spore germination protein [Tumebacillus amylolyticus]
MPRRFLCLLLILSLSVLPGCWDRTEINDLGIAIAATIDLTPDNKIMFSEQIYLPTPPGNGGELGVSMAGGQPYFVFSGIGDDIRAAHQNLQKMMSRRLFIADRNLYLISENVAKRGIQPYIDELVRNPQSRLRTHVAITKGDAVDYLKIKYPFEQTPGAALRKLVFGNVSNYNVDLNHMIRELQKPGEQVAVPMIKINPTSPNGEEAFQSAGIAVLKNGKLIGEVPYKQAKGVLWLRDEMKHDVETLSIPNHGTVTINLLQQHTDTKVEIKNGHPTLHVTILCEDDVVENNSDINLTVPENLDHLQTLYSNQIKQNILSVLDLLQHKYDADILHAAETVHRQAPKEWRDHLRKNWDEEFAKMPVHVEVQSKIERIGMTGTSLSQDSK